MSELPISGKVDVTVGERSVDKLIDAVVDTFSPATELLGALGDVVRLGRVEMAAHTVRCAKAIGDQAGLTLTAPPLKFLVPFFEKASLENENFELWEMWALLLVSASSSYTDQHIFYSDILSKIGPTEISILERLYKGKVFLDFHAGPLATNYMINLREELLLSGENKAIMPEVLQTRVGAHPEFPAEILEIFLRLEVPSPGAMAASAPVKLPHYAGKEVAFEILERERLIIIAHPSASAFGGLVDLGSYCHLSYLGKAFVEAVSKPPSSL